MSYQVRKKIYDFRGAVAPPAVGSRIGEFCSLTVETGGSPSVASVSGGSMDLALDATSEVQSATLYQGDILPFDIDDLIRVSFLAKISAALDSSVTAVIGLASAQNADPDAITEAAFFKLAGSNSLLCETDDGTTNNDDIATGTTLAATYKRLVIDFKTGVHSQDPPSLSLGGKSNVLFSVDNGNGSLRRVARNQRFDMSAYAGNLQLLAQIQKTSGTATGTLSILEAEVEYRLPA